MSDSSDKRKAVVVLPPAGNGRVSSRALRCWLARADLEQVPESQPLLERLLDALGAGRPAGGLAAVRKWGQTGEKPGAWLAAADPVYLEPELDRLRLHAIAPDTVPAAELERLVDHLQSTLGNGVRFERVDRHCYLAADTPFATANCPPALVDQRIPTDYLPGGAERASHRRLLSEIEMALHEHPVNAERAMAGVPVINSLWIWGGGYAPEPVAGGLPTLYADDPLLRGHWRAQQSPETGWPGSLGDCFSAGTGDFVAVVGEPRRLEQYLGELKRQLTSRRVDELVILFEDGLRATMTPRQGLRFWRRDNDMLRREARS